MFRCCFQPAAEDDTSVLATVGGAAHAQPRSRVVPTLGDGLADPSARVRGLKGPAQGRKLQATHAGGAGGGSATPGSQGKGQAPGPGGAGNGQAGPWGFGAGKASYRDPSLEHSTGKGLLASLLSRGSSNTETCKTEPITPRRSRRKLTGGGGGEGSDDGEDDDSCSQEPVRGSKHGSKDPVVAHMKTAQPKRGILKKADNPLDAAAGGDEEALLRLAAALASNPGPGGSPGSNPPGMASAALAAVSSSFRNSLRPASPGGGGTSLGTSDTGGGPATPPAAPGLGFGPRDSAALSSVDVTLDYQMGGSGRNSGNNWTDTAGSAAAAAVAAAAAAAATASIGGGGGTLRTMCSGSFQMASNPPISRLANSSTASAALGGDVVVAGGGGGGGGGRITGGGGGGSCSVKAISVRSTAPRPASPSSAGWRSGPSILYARESASAVPAVACDNAAALGRATSITVASLPVPAAPTPVQIQPSGSGRRQLSEIPTSYIVPVVPVPAPPPMLASVSFSTQSGGGGADGAGQNARSYSSAPGMAPAPRLPGDGSVSCLGGGGGGPSVRIQAFESASGGAGNRAVRGGSRRGAAQFDAATREEILRSLPAGKSPMWYAHKLREILGTAEAEDDDGGAAAAGGGAGGGSAGGPMEDLEYPPGERHARLAFCEDSSASRKVSFSRFRSDCAEGSSSGRALLAGDTNPAPLQRIGSRLLAPGQQMSVSVRHMAVAVDTGTPRSGHIAVPTVEPRMSSQQLALPGSLHIHEEDGDADGGGGGGATATVSAAPAVRGRAAVAVMRSAGSASTGSSGRGGGAAAAAAAALLLQRLQGGGSFGGFGSGAGACGGGGDSGAGGGPSATPLLHYLQGSGSVYGGVSYGISGVVADSSPFQSEPLAKMQAAKMYGNVGKLYDPGTAPKEMMRHSTAVPAFASAGRGDAVGGGGDAVGGGAAAAATNARDVKPAPRAAFAVHDAAVSSSATASPAAVIEEASRKLTDLLATLGEEDEEEDE